LKIQGDTQEAGFASSSSLLVFFSSSKSNAGGYLPIFP